jgi:hypothetical protein
MGTEHIASGAWDSQLLAALKALRNGDFSVRLPTGQGGTADEIAETYNATVEQLNRLVSECIRIAREVGPEGMYGGQAEVEALVGRWEALQDEVNEMGALLTLQIRNIARVIDGLVKGKPTEPITVPARYEMLHLKEAINQLLTQYGVANTTNV